MFPCNATNSMIYRPETEAIFTGQIGAFLSVSETLPQGDDIGLRKNGPGVMPTIVARDTHAALASHVINILFACAQPEMGGVTTAGIIAGMADELVTGNRAIGQGVGHSAGGGPSGTPNRKLAISTLVHGGKPRPAFIGATLVNFGPEPNEKLLCDRTKVNHHSLHGVHYTIEYDACQKKGGIG